MAPSCCLAQQPGLARPLLSHSSAGPSPPWSKPPLPPQPGAAGIQETHTHVGDGSQEVSPEREEEGEALVFSFIFSSLPTSGGSDGKVRHIGTVSPGWQRSHKPSRWGVTGQSVVWNWPLTTITYRNSSFLWETASLPCQSCDSNGMQLTPRSRDGLKSRSSQLSLLMPLGTEMVQGWVWDHVWPIIVLPWDFFPARVLGAKGS